jgi:hypothetical protein
MWGSKKYRRFSAIKFTSLFTTFTHEKMSKCTYYIHFRWNFYMQTPTYRRIIFSSSNGMLVSAYTSTRCYNPEDQNRHFDSRENLKSHNWEKSSSKYFNLLFFNDNHSIHDLYAAQPVLCATGMMSQHPLAISITWNFSFLAEPAQKSFSIELITNSF